MLFVKQPSVKPQNIFKKQKCSDKSLREWVLGNHGGGGFQRQGIENLSLAAPSSAGKV